MLRKDFGQSFGTYSLMHLDCRKCLQQHMAYIFYQCRVHVAQSLGCVSDLNADFQFVYHKRVLREFGSTIHRICLSLCTFLFPSVYPPEWGLYQSVGVTQDCVLPHHCRHYGVVLASHLSPGPAPPPP